MANRSVRTLFNPSEYLPRNGVRRFFFRENRLPGKRYPQREQIARVYLEPNKFKRKPGIFTSINYYHYLAPPDFCFDELCDDEPVIDDEEEEGYNIEEKCRELIDYFGNMALHYQQTELLHTFGSDFQYSNANKYFKNLDKLVSYINQHPEWGLKLLYSTPSRYIKAINALGLNYSTKTDDFMPYADEANAYWTGFYSSRPLIKVKIREAGRLLQSVRTIFSMALFEQESEKIKGLRTEMMVSVDEMEKNMGMLQHHDAVSGTSVQNVTDDYIYALETYFMKLPFDIDF